MTHRYFLGLPCPLAPPRRAFLCEGESSESKSGLASAEKAAEEGEETTKVAVVVVADRDDPERCMVRRWSSTSAWRMARYSQSVHLNSCSARWGLLGFVILYVGVTALPCYPVSTCPNRQVPHSDFGWSSHSQQVYRHSMIPPVPIFTLHHFTLTLRWATWPNLHIHYSFGW